MTKRCSRISSAVALLLLHVVCFFHCAAAARLFPAARLLVHQENGVKADTVDGLLLQNNGSPVNRDDLSVSEMMGTEDEEPACDEGNDECLQRRLLHDAHLDYIYTQHKGKP